MTTEIDGDVRDETTGEPLANAKVELRSDDDPGPEPVVTAADGIYRFQDVTSRDYRIAATAEGYTATGIYPNTALSGPLADGVHGRVVDASTAEPIANATVELRRETGGPKETVVTAADGRFRFPGIVGREHDISVRAKGYGARSIHGHSNKPGVPGRTIFRMRPRRPFLAELRRTVPLREWAAAALAISVLLWVGRNRWRDPGRPRVGLGVRAVLGCLVGLLVGALLSIAVVAGVHALADGLPPLPDGTLWLANLAASYALLPVAALCAPMLGLVVSVEPRVALVPFRSAVVAGCGGLAAGVAACYDPSRNGLAGMRNIAQMMEGADDRRTLAVYMAIVLAGGVLVAASAGLAVSYAITALHTRRTTHRAARPRRELDPA
ncbi:carboxypeptidase regulatory-like domain-containing protein [Candidatus Poribacteria bacterium]|nr:carboxypeptidase regulatory-like domain-containing protein [Candidatus Poribacteria bacterium]MBT5710965.1 carboxypeptidase regulatory-like domain-containing protein [Candidatus Poribacteria bacterium]MBT7098833.1 carboxypeptidase regulatory-like domain-containing protein [Candidatus Poribacteria bacterium]MBT7808191.1 carboxypeptidase regulatory-like domain-containing protein [Candidatus Poribacteria bacterium]